MESNRIEDIFKDYPDIVNVEQLQEMLDIGKNVAYNLLKNRIIESIKIGRVYKIPKTNIINFIMQSSNKIHYLIQ